MTDLTAWEQETREVVAEVRRKTADARAKLARVRGTATARRGELSVVVDGQGRVQGIRLAAHALKLGEKRLAELLLETIKSAEADAAAQSVAVTRPLAEDPHILAAADFARELES